MSRESDNVDAAIARGLREVAAQDESRAALELLLGFVLRRHGARTFAVLLASAEQVVLNDHYAKLLGVKRG